VGCTFIPYIFSHSGIFLLPLKKKPGMPGSLKT
jgi:hypothetical protein